MEIRNYYQDNFKDLYKLDLHLGEFADSINQPSLEFSTIIPSYYDYYYEEIEYNAIIYKIEEVSSCTSEYKFNLTLDKNIDINEKKIELKFKGSDGMKNYIVNNECILSSKYNNLAICQSDDETKDLNYTMDDFIIIEKNQLIAIFIEQNKTFSLFCYEKPPIAGIIVIVGLFLLIVIIVIIIILYLNKKGKGGKKYNNIYDKSNVIINSNNISSRDIIK